MEDEKQSNEVPVMTRVSQENAEGLRLSAKAQKRSVAYLVRELIEKHVSKFEDEITRAG